MRKEKMFLLLLFKRLSVSIDKAKTFNLVLFKKDNLLFKKTIILIDVLKLKSRSIQIVSLSCKLGDKVTESGKQLNQQIFP